MRPPELPREPAETFGIELTSDGTMEHAFQVAFERHRLPKRASIEAQSALASDLFTAAVAHLVHFGKDSYLKEVGRTSWWMNQQARVQVMLVSNPHAVAVKFGVPIHHVIREGASSDQIHVLFAAQKKSPNKAGSELGLVLLPTAFIQQARREPIQTLGSIAWAGSQIRDFANNRLDIDVKEFNPRAGATEAQFFIYALRLHPELMQDPYVADLVRKYPRGISDLSKNLIYRGNDQQPQQARWQ
jgi:hypothetical protein